MSRCRNYHTVTSAEEDDMARHRRRSPKDGGGQATIQSSIINLLNTIIGAGTLAMPAAMSHMGIMAGVFVIVWSAMCSAFGLYLQSRCARYLERGTSSFFALSQLTYPNAAVFFDTAIAIKCFGVGVSYIIIIGDLMPGVMIGMNPAWENVDYLMDRKFWITAFMLGIIPLSFLKRLDSLKYTSVVALISIGYLIVLVVYHFSVDEHAPHDELRVIAWESPLDALKALPVVIFAYTCHQNMFSILNELKSNAPSSVYAVIGSSIGSAASVYILVAMTGYITFGNSVVGNIISMYTPNFASTFGKMAIVVLVTFSIPLQVHPCRASLDSVINSLKKMYDTRWESALTIRPPNGNRPLLNPNIAMPVSDHPVGVMSELRFALITTFLLICSYITAIKVNSLDTVLAYVGATGSTSISFILPGVFYYKISDPESIHHQRLAKEDDDINNVSVSDDAGGATEVSIEIDGDTETTDAFTDIEDAVGRSASMAAEIRAGLAHSQQVVTLQKWRRRWRWDLEHVDHGILRKMALGLACYGICVMVVSLSIKIFAGASGH